MTDPDHVREATRDAMAAMISEQPPVPSMPPSSATTSTSLQRTQMLVAASVVALVAAAGVWAGMLVFDDGGTEEANTTAPDATSTTNQGPASERASMGEAAPGAVAINVRLLIDGPRDEPDLTVGPTIAGQSISEFGYDLFNAVADPTQNVVVSPASIAIALAMLEPGAVGDALDQLRATLRIEDPVEWHASMNALEQSLEARVVEAASVSSTSTEPLGSESAGRPQGSASPGEVAIRIANAAYLQDGYPFESTYLEAIRSNYGPVLNTVDFLPDPDAVAREINRFVAEETDGRIADLMKAGDITPLTRLALVNALYLKVSWLDGFEGEATQNGPFTRLNGSSVDVPMMEGTGSSSARGSGWIGATKSNVGGLSVQFILPDEGRFDDIVTNLRAVFSEYEENRAAGPILVLPMFEARSSTELRDALAGLGLVAPFGGGGLLGIADDPDLHVEKVVHEAFVAMDEEGIEAAAATAVVGNVIFSGPAVPATSVVLDRPFIYRIFDETSGATLFLGQIVDPTI